VKNNLEIFREHFLNANSYSQRRDGIPLYLLDELTEDELRVAENEMIDVLNIKDDWPIKGLGYIRSKGALSKLYRLLVKSKKGIKVIVAHSIFQISRDRKMIEITLSEMPKISNQYVLIDLVYLLQAFEDRLTDRMLNDYRNHKEYLVAYNATRAMGLSTEKVIEKFRSNKINFNDNSLLKRFKNLFNIKNET
jgi:hypothetical protein